MAAFNGRAFAAKRGVNKTYKLTADDKTSIRLQGWAPSLTEAGFRTLGLSQVAGVKGTCDKDEFAGGTGRASFELDATGAADFAAGVVTGREAQEAKPEGKPQEGTNGHARKPQEARS